MKIIYKKRDENCFDIVIDNHNLGNPVGQVYRNLGEGVKWKIQCYFYPLLDDAENLDDKYFDSVKAARILVSAWERLKAAQMFIDTKEYDITELFGTD